MPPTFNNSLRDAEEAIRRAFAAEGFEAELRYDSQHLRETADWWYFPCGWIGSLGCIVDKRDLYVNFLASGIGLDMAIWGHERGIFCDLVDFAFAPDTSLDLVAKLLERFQHMFPNAAGVLPKYPVWYRDSEIGSALSSQFPVFRRHCVWHAIPEIRHACEHDELQFTSTLSSRA